MLAFTLIAPLLLAFHVTSATSESAVRKCRNPAQKAPVIFVDGQVVSDSAFKRFTSSDIWSVEVVCINPADSTVLKAGSSVAGIGAIIVWTKLGPSTRLEPALSAVLGAQRAFLARTGAYSRDLTSLELPALPIEVKLSMESTSNGWSASAWVDRRFSPRCSVSEGNVDRAGTKSNGVIACS